MAARSEGAQQPLSSSTAAVTENPTKPKGISQRTRYIIEPEYEADWAELPVYPETDDQSESEEDRTDDGPKTVKENQVVMESALGTGREGRLGRILEPLGYDVRERHGHHVRQRDARERQEPDW